MAAPWLTALCLWLVSVVCFVVVKSQSSFKKLEESCAVDTECHDNMLCQADTATPNNRTCICDKGFARKADSTCGSGQGTWCANVVNCADNTKCSSSKCVCKDATVVKTDNSCGRIAEQKCIVDLDCADHMACQYGKCVCASNFTITPLKTCELPCPTQECEPGGGCFVVGDLRTHTCYCYDGYTGSACQYPTVTYNILVSTGASDHAQSDMKLNADISGTNGTTGKLLLSWAVNTRGSIMEKGKTDHFQMTSQDVGKITNVTLSYLHINPVYVDRWFLEAVTITREDAVERVYTFVFHTWIYLHTFVTLSDPCVMSSCGNESSCTHVGFVSRAFNCTCDVGIMPPICAADVHCSYGRATYDVDTDFQCQHSHGADSDVTAHAAIVESVQQLANVSECVCQGDVSGFYVRLVTPIDNSSTTAPTADCPQTSSWCEKQGTNYCFNRETHARTNCQEKCGYCPETWQRLTPTGSDLEHVYRRVYSDSLLAANVTSLEAECDTYQVRVYEVACFGPNHYLRAALCQGGRDNQVIVTCPAPTTPGEVTTPQETTTTITTTTPTTTTTTTLTTTTTTPTTTTATTPTTTTTPPTATTTRTTTTTTTPAINPYTRSCRTVCQPETTPTATSLTSEEETTPYGSSPSPPPSSSSPAWRCTNATGPQIPDGMSLDQFKAMLVKQIKEQLTLETSSLAKSRARKASAPDPRPSSQTAGIMAVGVIVCVGVVMLTSDLTSLVIWRKGRSPRVEP